MLENVIKNTSIQIRITIKSIISAGLITLSALLPLLIHAVAGPTGGAQWLPMYLPVIVGGCLLGSVFGAAIGVCSPIVSFFISQAVLGSAMPVAAKLPFMIAELAVFGLTAGLFTKSISKKPLLAFSAVLAAQVVGKTVNLIIGAIVIAASGSGIYAPLWTSIKTGLPGLYLQAILIPFIIILLAKIKNEPVR